MITQLRFQNFKALKNAELKLGTFNIIIGPNGSGKSSVLQGLKSLAEPNSIDLELAASVGTRRELVKVNAILLEGEIQSKLQFQFYPNMGQFVGLMDNQGGVDLTQPTRQRLDTILKGIRIFSFEASSLGHPVSAQQIRALQPDGRNLVGALTHLRDKDEDAYDHLRKEFQRWIPEYDSIGFENDQQGVRHLKLRQKVTKQTISASQASEGTLLALALLTIVYQPGNPILVGLEEPDRGLHPRLLRELRDALYRLSFPSDFGIQRNPVQVVVTTHSPFFLDLFKEHPEQVIIAEKQSDGTATFKNLSEDKELREKIGDAPLGEVWYSGVLGGVPIPA